MHYYGYYYLKRLYKNLYVESLVGFKGPNCPLYWPEHVVIISGCEAPQEAVWPIYKNAYTLEAYFRFE